VRRGAVLAVVTVAALLLTGCAESSTPSSSPTPTASYPSDLASRLQSAVLSVSSSAAEDDPTSALARLEELTATLADARARGEVTASRFDSISAAIALVRTDLEAAILAKDDTKPGKPDKPGKGNGGKDG